jgi:hypothetical protein
MALLKKLGAHSQLGLEDRIRLGRQQAPPDLLEKKAAR